MNSIRLSWASYRCPLGYLGLSSLDRIGTLCHTPRRAALGS
jgi:hypothetical protein